jgi:multidrug resistance efflux pump
MSDESRDARQDADRKAQPAKAPKTVGRPRRILRLFATGLILACAFVAAALVWQFYVTAPWTRDGRVRVQVASVAPQVSGQIVELRVTDNQAVNKGDVLYVIDPFDFDVAIASAQAEMDNREADLQVKRTQAARREALTTLSTSVEEKQQFAGTAKIAEAALASAKAQLSQAKINRTRTEVRAPVNGRVTNLLLRVGDYATTGTVNIAVIDTDSFWIDGYFEETKMAHIHVGDTVSAQLLGYDPIIRGRVESITLGISIANAAPSTQGLPSVDPVYTWVRLAQRVPVRVRIEGVPAGVTLVAGMTATVSVGEPGVHGRNWWAALRQRVSGWAAPTPNP